MEMRSPFQALKAGSICTVSGSSKTQSLLGLLPFLKAFKPPFSKVINFCFFMNRIATSSFGIKSTVSGTLKRSTLILMLLLTGFSYQATAADESISTGSFIINMGITPQTVGNGLKPYGLIYDLLKNNKVPIKWVIKPTKVKDGIDFSHNGVDYKGGAFIIPAEFRTAAVNAKIVTWQGLGVVGATTVSPITVPVYTTLVAAPIWTLDKNNGGIATGFFAAAGIPAAAYGGSSSANWPLPSQLDCCDDLFIMPHADPKWLTHERLYTWNLDCRGSIWLGCHAGSALEDMFDNIAPVDYNVQTNFLAEKTGPATGAGPYSENALLLWGNHDDGTLPYSYDYPTDPVMQFIGTIDAAVQNGSEQIYIPKGSGWRPTTKVGVYDPDHPDRYTPYLDPKHRAAVLAYGPGFGDPARGYEMLEASHNIGGTGPANVAAQRAFFNFGFLTASEKAVIPTISGLSSPLYSGTAYPLSYSIPAPADPINYTATWTASCGGTFTPTNVGQNVTYTPPVAVNPTSCIIIVSILDGCGRETFASQSVTVQCNLQVATTLTNPCFGQPNSGAISMSITNGSGPYVWNWTRSGGGTGMGSGTLISGLSAGTYTVTVTADNGAGCPATFTVSVSQSPQIVITATPLAVLCNGGSTGGINIAVSGGVPGYTYLWNSGATTQNRSGLTAGTYNLTVTDSKGCTATSAISVVQPAALSIVPTATNVTCFGQSNGMISLAVTGGVSPYTYLWNDGSFLQNRTGLAPGTYAVTVTDANSCTQVYNNISITEPAAALSLSSTQVNVLCYGGSTGSINLSVSGGTSPYTFAWSGPGMYSAVTEDISGRAAGIYVVTVTDSKACTAVLSVTITESAAFSLSTVVVQPTCPPSAQFFNSNGTIDLTVNGGTSPFTYDWTDLTPPPVEPEDRSGLAAGTYTVTVTDANGCVTSTSVTLTNLNPNPVPPSGINH